MPKDVPSPQLRFELPSALALATAFVAILNGLGLRPKGRLANEAVLVMMFVPTYRCGAVPEFHRIPFCSVSRTRVEPRIALVAILNPIW